MSTDTALEHKMVLYCDAGARPNPGYGGWGIHGYLYTEKTSKTSTGHTTHIPTAKGYQRKSDVKDSTDPLDVEVEVVTYFDGLSTLGLGVTNNLGEVVAATKCLELADRFEITELLILTDSTYVIDGATKYVFGWMKRGWRNKEGGEVKNSKEWKDHVHTREVLRKKGVEIQYVHVFGHNGDLGNTMADTYATIGVNLSKNDQHRSEIDITDSKGYWRYDSERHPFLNTRTVYYMNRPGFNTKGLYFCGQHGKLDELVGTRMAEGALSVIWLDQPEDVIESIREQTEKLAQQRSVLQESFMMGKLGAIYKPEFHKLTSKFGMYSMYPAGDRSLTMKSAVDDEHVVLEVNPPMLAFRIIDNVELLLKTFNRYEAKDPEIIITDLTDILYETKENKKGVKSTTLRNEIDGSLRTLDVETRYQTTDKVETSKVKLVLGVDLLNRNSLKRLETLNPVVQLITWKENDSDTVFRYATIISIDGAKGIWAGMYSNYRYLFDKVKQDKVVKLIDVL